MDLVPLACEDDKELIAYHCLWLPLSIQFVHQHIQTSQKPLSFIASGGEGVIYFVKVVCHMSLPIMVKPFKIVLMKQRANGFEP